jgi:putative peptidoglycan lipid II flippase
VDPTNSGGAEQPDTRDRAERSDRAEAAGIPAAAALLAGSVLLSRVIGFVREGLLAYQVGATATADAYYAAFQLPDMLNYFLAGGALSTAFLPLYAKLRAGDEAGGERLLATVLGTLGLLAVCATIALWLGADALIALQFPNFDPGKQALTVQLTRIVLPAQIFFVIGGVLQASLLARGRFVAAALAPLVYNGCIVLGGVLLAPQIGVAGFSWGALLGAVLGPFAIPWLDARRRVRIRIRVAPRDPQFVRYLVVAAPLMFGLTLLTVDEWYDRYFGGLLADGAIAVLVFARRLMAAPVAVVGQAIGQAAMPALANLWAAGRAAELDRVLGLTLRAALALGILAGTATVALAGPLVELVYHRGAFTAEDAARVTWLLTIFSAAVPAWVVQQIAVRGFYARGQTWRPMLLGTGFAIAAIPVYLAFGWRFGVEGLAAAGVVAMTGNALATIGYARWLHGGPAFSPILGTAWRAGGIAVVAGVAARAVLGERSGMLGALTDLGIGGCVFVGVGGLGIVLLGDEALRRATSGLTRRFWRRRVAR